MLTKKTVLVLGAGASKPYGFPTGLELSEIISLQFQQGQNTFENLRNLGHAPAVMAAFRNEFYKSGRNSVDAFLEHRKDLIEIGKLAIAATLVPKESEEPLFAYQDSWLRLLYNNMNASFDEFGKNTLSIITYNYDRSVEHFLMTALENSYGRKAIDCFQVLKTIPIIHLHGSLGPLPWQVESGEPNRPYHFAYNNDLLKIAQQHIKIIHEDIQDGRDADFELAKKLLNDAEQILFLGFGYNPINLERLKIKEIDPNGKSIIGTSIGLGEADKREVARNCGDKIAFVPEGLYQIISERMQWH
jgi:hypothetical protein